MTMNCVYSIPCSCIRVYKGEICHSQKVRLEEHQKAVVQAEIQKSSMVDHKWKGKGNPHPLGDEVKIIDWEEHWRIRHLKEAVH